MAATKVLAAILALALACQTAAANKYALYEYCREISRQMAFEPETWANATIAYETAMKHVKSPINAFDGERRCLGAAWRAVTLEEPCSSSSLAFVRAIYACQPSTNPSQRHLEEDARKYARRCLTADYLEAQFEEKFAGADLESFLSAELLAAYHQDNPDEAPLHFGTHLWANNCCRPARAFRVLAEAVSREFPQEAAKFRAGEPLELVGEFLAGRLYKPCASYLQRVDKFMDELQAANHYALDGDLGRLPRTVQAAVFRYKFCQNLQSQKLRDSFSSLVADQF